MAIANFDEFCRAFCELAAIPRPDLSPDPHGAFAFTVLMRGVSVTVLHVPSRPDVAYVMAELGSVPEHSAMEAWRALLDANMLLRGKDAPVFSRNPQTGDVILQRAFPLGDATAVHVYEQVELLVAMARQWQQGNFLAEPLTEIQTHKVVVLQSPEHGRDYAFVMMNLGSPAPQHEPLALITLMETNFALMTDECPPACSRDPATGDLFMQFAHSLVGACADAFPSRIFAVSSWADEWRRFYGSFAATQAHAAPAVLK